MFRRVSTRCAMHHVLCSQLASIQRMHSGEAQYEQQIRICMSLPIVLGRCTGVARAQRLCQRCHLHAVHDERHHVFECPAMQCVRDRVPAMFSTAKNNMQLFMWQHDIVGVAHYIKIVLRCLVP